ncbi:hypothetical protein WSM22_05070 [Cytophagales bacterium WSM2-2]|nr:hypothetical protein WSM22_05070 [Cytophagales bacterium WSM2-2]
MTVISLMSEVISIEDIDRMTQNAYEMRMKDLHLSIVLAEQALQKSSELKYATGEAKLKNHLSLYHFIRCDFEKSLNYANEALTFYESTGDLNGVAAAKYNIGSSYYRTENFSEGLIHMFQALKIFEHLQDHSNQARVLKSIGTIYEYFQDYAYAESSYQKCIEVSRKIEDLNSESNAYNPLSGLYLKQGKIEMAAGLIDKSIAMKKRTGDRRGLAFAIYGRGKVLVKQKNYQLAERDYLECLSMHEESGDQLGLCMVCNKLGQLYMESKDYQQSREYFRIALEQSKRLKITIITIKTYYQLYLLAKQEGNTAEAFSHLEKYIQLKESVIGTQTLHVIKSYEEKAKIEALETEARIQNEKREIIENKNAELDSFFYRVSHDLKGPIASLMGLHMLVKNEIKDTDALRYFEMYHTQTNRINNIVMGLIGLTQMKHLQDTKVTIDFATLVDECIASYTHFENFKQIKFIKDIDRNLNYFSEWAIINTILQNLIENAIKYSKPNEPYIRISIHQEGDFIRLEVEDNGMGIDDAHQAKIFDMFYRASERTKGSSGLGLYILKRAVERLNATIELKSKLNKGSTFAVILPN